jgi:hypothetical protein
MKHSRRLVAMLTCCVAASAVLVGHASAGQIFQESYHHESTVVNENFCGAAGLTTRHDFVVDGKVRAVSRGPDGFEYFLDHLKETEVITNLDNGKTITAVHTYTRKDLYLSDNGDGTLTAVELLTGTTVLYGADAKSIARTTGQSRSKFLIDHGGTPTDPSDDELIDVERVKRSGRGDDLCAAFVSAIT